MALTFPSSPSNGQIYADTTTGNRYIYNATAGVWSFAANNVGMSVSSTPPSNVAPGAMWFNREIGRTFVYYDDGDSKQWIETVPAGAVDTNVVAGYVNPVFASINSAYTTANAGFGKANTALQNTSGTFSGTLTSTTSFVAGASTSNVSITSTAIAVNNANLSFPGCGRLNYTDTNTVTYVPYNGNVIKIAGSLYTIPPAGIAGTRTNCYINGVAGQTLTANTTYYVYVFNNSGTLALDFSTTSHGTDTSVNNCGVECKNADNSRSLVGMVYPYSNAFMDDNRRLVLSWFNRQQKNIYVNGGGNFTSTSTSVNLVTPNALGTYVPIMLNWGDMPTTMTYACQINNTGAYGLNALYYDNSGSNGFGPGTYAYSSPYNMPCFLAGTIQLSEGFHSYWLGLTASSGSGTVTNLNGNWIGHTWG